MQALALITGFLGSGKTTLLRELALSLSSSELQVNAILNDYSNAEIDSALIQEVVSSLSSISGSCVCCESRDELFDALSQLPRKEPGLILVEANGGADPIELVELMSFDPRCQHLANPLVLTLIHAKRWQKRLFRRSIEREQLRPATHYFISHQAQVSSERLVQVRRDIARINTHAKEISSTKDFCLHLQDLAQSLQGKQGTNKEFKPAPQISPLLSEHFPEHKHTHPFASLSLPLPDQVNKAALEAFLHQLPAEVLRAKAFVKLAPENQPAVMQYMDDGMTFWMDIQATVETPPTLVLIGPELNEEVLTQQLREHLQDY